MKKFRRGYWYKAAVCACFIHLIAYTANAKDELISANVEPMSDTDAYKINFNNVSIIELIRFTSKITNINFVFEEADLQFSVTFVSEEAVTAKNVMAAVLQILRMHDLLLLEQDGSVLITKSTKVSQIAPIVSSDLLQSEASRAALVTRVFRIKNANVNSIANIIRPMTSEGALIEVSLETRQLIVTDIATNVEQIASLLTSLDSPHTPLDVDTYVVKNIAPQELIALTEQILTAFADGNPLIFVAQADTNSIYIVSTPYLIERAVTIMQDLDIPPKPVVIGKPSLNARSVFIYNTVNRSATELISELGQIASQLKAAGGVSSSLEIAIQEVREIKETGSLMFVVDADSLTKLKDILSSLDAPSAAKTSFYIYKIQSAPQDKIAASLKEIENQLETAPHPDLELIDAIDSMNWIPESNSLVFIGSKASLAKLEEIIPVFDVIPSPGANAQGAPKSTFLVYHPQSRPGDQLKEEVDDLYENLKESGLSDPAFLQTLQSMKWVPATNSLIFTGDPQSVDKLQTILKSMDTSTAYGMKSSQVFIYKPQYASVDQIQNALQSLVPSLESTHTLSDQNLVNAIGAMQWNAQTGSFMVTSDPVSIDRLKALLSSIDSPGQAIGVVEKGFFLYKLQHAKCDAVLTELKNIADKMPLSTLQNQNLVAAINRIECIQSNNSLLITGTGSSIEQIKTLITEFDTSTGVSAQMGAQSFLIYKPKYLPAEEIQAALSDLAQDLQASGLSDPQLFLTLSSMRYVSQTGSLLFTGSQEGLDKLQTLINSIDTSAALGAIQSIGNVTFLIYKPQVASPDKLISSLKAFAFELNQAKVEDKQLAETINGVRWIKDTNSLLFTGSSQSLEKVEQLVKKFDIPSLGGPPPIERAAPTFVIYNPKYVSGDDLISILCDFMQNLISSGVSDPNLFDTISNLKWIDKTSSLILSGNTQSIEKTEQLLLKFDIPSKESAPPAIESIDKTSFLVYKLRFHAGNAILKALKQIASSTQTASTPPKALIAAIDSLQWIEVTNSLLCTGEQDVLVKLKELVQNLDIPLRQVFIEVLVIETSLNNQQNFGLMWGSQVQYFNKTVLQTGNFPVPSGQGSSAPTPATTFPPNLQTINATTTPNNTLIPFSSGFDLGVIGDIIMHKGKSFISLGSLMNALQLDTDSTILLNPKIITQDNRQSTVFIGQNIPYTGSLITNNTTAQGTSTANIEYIDVGVSLTITPILGDGDMISLDIVQDIREAVSSTNATTSPTQLTGIQTSQAHLETRVNVPNNHFVALSGMINDSKTHFRTAIPCLGGLPVVGLLFSENDRTAVKQNVIIFLRPQIIHSYQEYKAITEHQEWLYKDNARKPILKEEFDEGLDIVKPTPNE
jgi:type III secretion protein C